MKCELCHKAEAETAMTRGEGEDAEELYVCRACAKSERQRRQKKSQTTRKSASGLSMSITEISAAPGGEDGEPPPFIGAIVNAFHDMVSDFEKARSSAKKKEIKYHDFPISRVPAAYRICGRLHLEGLFLIGEIDAVKRAMNALKMELADICVDGLNNVGHIYTLRYSGSVEQAKRVVEDLLREERNARVRLLDEMPRVFGDAVCRALAILKNCRLLSNGELFDMLSPLRLAAQEKMLDGITLSAIEKLMTETDLSGADERLGQNERDRMDAERADVMNDRFADVMLDESAEERLM